jgi:energy-coupling factor transport system permease protein
MDLLRSLPLGLYLEQPITWLHRLDPRVKLAWLMTFLAAPLLANPLWRILLAGLLILITFAAMIPIRVWRQQMVWLLAFSLLVFTLTAILPDGLKTRHQSRLPANELTFGQESAKSTQLPATQPWYDPSGWFRQSPSSGETQTPPLQNATQTEKQSTYRYVLIQRGPITITRRSLDLGIRVSTLLFTLIYSTNLYLLTTAPEEITAAIENWMEPLRRFKLPITEIALTLTLSLRFIPLVLEEFQNLVRSVYTRAINWKKLGIRHTIQVWMIVAERLLENLLLRAEQIAGAMKVRGFTSPNTHRVEWYQFRLRQADWLALASLIGLWVARCIWGWER